MVSGRVLVVAGSDSSGGAGLEADQKTIAAHGCYAMTATTALTAQNTLGVHGVHPIPASFVRQQIEACLHDVGADVIKTGMLASAETIDMLADIITQKGSGDAAPTTAAADVVAPAIVVDPVMISTSGAELLPREAIRSLIGRLLPHVTLLTPNVPEADHILAASAQDVSAAGEREIQSVEDLEATARAIQALGPRWVLVKGGHRPFTADLKGPGSDVVVDVLVGPSPDDVVMVKSPWQDSTSTHGTGCTLASAIASGIAKGLDIPTAVRAACRYVEVGIRTAPKLGGGHGPLNHFHSTYSLPFSPGYFIEYLLQRPDVKAAWRRFVHHPFVMAMGNGKLPLASFKGYIVQDYLYLIHFSRANALAAYKADNMKDIARAAEIVSHIMRETQLHINYCQSFDMSVADILATEEHQACTAYTRYVLDVGQSGDWLALQMAMAPCLLGYFAVASMLRDHEATVREGNVYWAWIQNYVADDYTEAVRLGSELIEKSAALQSPARIEELVKIFIHATNMEIGFWEMFPSQ